MRGSNQINSTRALSLHQHAIALSLFWWCVLLFLNNDDDDEYDNNNKDDDDDDTDDGEGSPHNSSASDGYQGGAKPQYTIFYTQPKIHNIL